MTVHFDGKEYKITRQPPGFSRAVETIKEACNEMEPEQPKQNKDPCEKCDGKGYYCVNLPLEGDPPDNRRHCEICGGKGYREQPKRERRERGIIVSRNGSETLCRNYPNTIVIGRQTEYRVREVLPGDPDPDEQAEIRQWMDSDDPRKYRLETLELGLREAAERWGVKASFVSRCERGQNASARDMEVLHAKLTPHVQGRLDEQAAETERWNLAADDYRRKWYETQDMQVAVESERDQLAAELEAVKAVKEVSISRSCGECEFWQFGCRGFNKHKDEGYCNLTPTQINKQRGDWCAQFRPKGTPPTKADSQ